MKKLTLILCIILSSLYATAQDWDVLNSRRAVLTTSMFYVIDWSGHNATRSAKISSEGNLIFINDSFSHKTVGIACETVSLNYIATVKNIFHTEYSDHYKATILETEDAVITISNGDSLNSYISLVFNVNPDKEYILSK